MPLLGDGATRWKSLREAIATATGAGALQTLENLLQQLSNEGPVAALIRQVSPALAPMARPGQDPQEVARTLMEFNITLAPEIAQRWALRVLGLPFRFELVGPVVDDAYATALIDGSQMARRVLVALESVDKDSGKDSSTSKAELVRLILSDDAVATLNERLDGQIPADEVTAMVEVLQKKAVEQQLERDIAPEKLLAFGGLRALLDAIDRVRKTDDGQRALDVLLGIVRRARAAGASIVDLLFPGH